MYILWRYKHGMQFYSKDMREGVDRVASQKKRKYEKKDMNMRQDNGHDRDEHKSYASIVNHGLTYKN
jgi:hypothetical protein